MFRLVLALCFIFSFTSPLLAEEMVKAYYFGATWCSPCEQMKNLFKDKEVAKELSKFDFQMYDIDKSPDLKNKYKITKIPTLIFINKKKQTRYVGSISKKQLLKILSKQSN